MTTNKKNSQLRGMIIGIVVGIIWGYAMDNIALGIGMGVAYGAALGRILSGEELIKDKKTRRKVSWGLLGISILGCLAFGYIVGNIVLGVTAGIGFSFVIGLKWEKLYDERISSIFNKAARNAFVTVNAGLSLSLMFSLGLETPIIIVPFGELLQYVIYLSWIVFLFSWFYHANLRGE